MILEILKQYVLSVIKLEIMTTANTEQANLLSHTEDLIKKTKPRDPILKKNERRCIN